MTRLVLAGLVALVVVAAGPGARADMLIGASLDGTIYDIDPTTGLASNPRETGIEYLTGIAFAGDGTLFGRTAEWGSQPQSLFQIEAETGTSTVVGFIGRSGGDVDFDATTGVLYAVSPFMGTPYAQLYTIDTSDGTPSTIGTAAHWASSLAFDPTGVLYALDSSDMLLVTLNKTTGEVLASLPLVGASIAYAVEFVDDGMPLATGKDAGGTNTLYALDALSGVLTEVGPLGVQESVWSLAYIPEPTTLALVGVGIGLALRRRRG